MFKGYLSFFSIATCALLSVSATAQVSNGVVNNIERAHTLMDDVYGELNYNNTVGDIGIRLSGTYFYEGVKSKPGSAREFAMKSDITLSKGGAQLLRKDTFTRAGEDVITSFYDIDNEHLNVSEAGVDMKPTDKDRDKYLYQSLIFTPNMLLQVMLSDASKNNFISTDDKYHIIRHNNESGDVFFLYINSKTYYLERIEQPAYDNVSGDHFRSIIYSDYNIMDGYQVPGKMVIKRDSSVVYNLKLEYKEILPRVDYGMARLSQKTIGEWLYAVPMTQWNCNTVIADMKDFLVLIEPPATVEAGYTLLDNIKRAYPGKEIKYVVVSHIHPERMGGIRPFMEDGCIIVTTEGNREYFNNIARNKHIFSKDVRVKKFITPKFQFVNMNRYELKAGPRVIQLFLLNKHSHHEDEYIISYIPSEKIMVEGDLVKTDNLKERALDRKEKGLVDFIEAERINVKQMVQNWQPKGAPVIFDYDVIKPKSGNKLIQGSKKVLDVFN